MHSEHMRDCEELGCGCEISYFRMEPFAEAIRRLRGSCVIVTCECANCECMPLPVNAHNPYDLPLPSVDRGVSYRFNVHCQ